VVSIDRLVHRFYDDCWNRWDDAAVDEVLAEDFAFHGSLGDEAHGRTAWRAYRDRVRAAAPDFNNEVIDLIWCNDRAAVRLRYAGHHRGDLLGIAGTGRRFEYDGTGFFTSKNGVLSAAWVLGDLDSLRRQLTQPWRR
jgi:predicted ester cyclase